ncbi:MAG: hypothetical protein EOO24_57420 [Comamonadaceae bacterium]|nr:MAG: hypothetical protein EOO24_57420 [Comamonadaceae bacterium]
MELDLERAASQLDGDAQLVRDLVAAFLRRAPGSYAEYRAALVTGDREAVLRYLHRTVPTLALLARADLAAEARTLYDAVIDAPGPIDAWMPRLQALAQRLAQLLDEAAAQVPR